MKDVSALKITKKDLLLAAKNGVLSQDGASLLWNYLAKTNSFPNRLLTVIYYFGASCILLAMTWFMIVALETYQGLISFFVSVVYGICFYISGYFLWKIKKFELPAGLLVTASIFMVPLAIYSLQVFFHLGPVKTASYSTYYCLSNTNWIFMDIAGIIAGSIAICYIRSAFLMIPIGCFIWMLSTDCFPLCDKNIISLLVGIGMLICSYILDQKNKPTFAFYGYLFGSLTFFGSLIFLQYSSAIHWTLYLLIQITAVVVGTWIKRKTIIFFGSLGILSYLIYLAYDVFANETFFSIGLAFIGILLLGAGLLYQKSTAATPSQL